MNSVGGIVPSKPKRNASPHADQVFADLLARHRDQEGQPAHRVAFVSHGGFFVRLLSAILKLPWRQASNN